MPCTLLASWPGPRGTLLASWSCVAWRLRHKSAGRHPASGLRVGRRRPTSCLRVGRLPRCPAYELAGHGLAPCLRVGRAPPNVLLTSWLDAARRPACELVGCRPASCSRVGWGNHGVLLASQPCVAPWQGPGQCWCRTPPMRLPMGPTCALEGLSPSGNNTRLESCRRQQCLRR